MCDHADEHTALLAAVNNSELVDSNTDERDDDDDGTCNFSWRRWRYYLIEPVILVLIFAYSLSSTIMKNRIIYQTCTAVYGYSRKDCLLLGTKNTSTHIQEIEHTVQPYTARIFMVTSMVESIFPALCGFFIGGIADRVGRKPLLIVSYTGYALYYGVAAVISYWATRMPVSPWYYLCAVLPLSLMGGNVPYTVAALCFLSDVSSEIEKPYRMVFYEAAIYIGLMAGSFAAGYFYEATNSHTIFSISSGSIAFALLIILTCVPESLQLRVLPDENASRHSPFALVTEMWAVCCKRRHYKDRLIVWLAISALLLTAFVVDGGTSVFYLFVREKFHWTVKEFTTYETVGILIPLLGNLFGTWLLRKTFRCSILHLAVMAFISQVLCSLMRGFAAADIQLYVAILMGSLKSLASPMLRTVIMNIVPASELGKLLTFNGVLVAYVPMIAAPVYTFVYYLTLQTFPGGFNILSAILFLLAIGLVLIIMKNAKIHPLHYESILS